MGLADLALGLMMRINLTRAAPRLDAGIDPPARPSQGAWAAGGAGAGGEPFGVDRANGLRE